MTTILQLHTSLSGESGLSSRLASDFSRALAGATGAAVVVGDLARQPVPHLTAERFAAFTTEASARTLMQQRPSIALRSSLPEPREQGLFSQSMHVEENYR